MYRWKRKYTEIHVTPSHPPHPPKKNLTQLLKEEGESIVSKLMRGTCLPGKSFWFLWLFYSMAGSLWTCCVSECSCFQLISRKCGKKVRRTGVGVSQHYFLVINSWNSFLFQRIKKFRVSARKKGSILLFKGSVGKEYNILSIFREKCGRWGNTWNRGLKKAV